MGKSVSASDGKNNFGGLLEDVASLGRVDILKHGRLVAVMLSPRALEAALAAAASGRNPGQEGQEEREGPDGKWGRTHMIPPELARAARMLKPPSTFDED
jgi:antitoxin (DNA-binding transcriptional repressor) of toxin-antitoxin stability system